MKSLFVIRPSRKPAHVFAATAVAATIAFASNAEAQRIAIRGEFAGGTMLSPFQTQTLGFFPALQGTGRFGVSIIDPLAVQVSFSSWWFPRARGDGQLFAPTAGLRFEPRIGRVGRFFVDANVGPGWTPDRWRVYLDAGLGFEFMITPWFGLGPVARYGHFFHANETGGDAQFWSLGLSIVFRPGAHDDRERAHAREHHPRDRDRDRDRERERERERNQGSDSGHPLHITCTPPPGDYSDSVTLNCFSGCLLLLSEGPGSNPYSTRERSFQLGA